MKNKKILITGGNKELRDCLAETIRVGCSYQGGMATVTDFSKFDVISSVEIPKGVMTAIFVAGHEGKKLTGVYQRLVSGSRDKLEFVHLELK
jgi:hypothetical protein